MVADFGIALDQAKEGRLTQTGTSLGSPVYMSPEQAGGEGEVDVQTDIYSLGCVLYEVLGGSPVHGLLSASAPGKEAGRGGPSHE